MIERIGKNIRKLRKNKNISVTGLAHLVGCSPSFISGVESGKVLPSLTSLEKVANALNIPMVELFVSSALEEPVIMRQKDRIELVLNNWDTKVYLLVKNISGKRISPFYTIIKPGHGNKAFAWHEGEEFGIVLKGKLEINLNGNIYLVKKNESFYYLSEIPHRWYNPGKQDAIVLWIASPPVVVTAEATDVNKFPRKSGFV